MLKSLYIDMFYVYLQNGICLKLALVRQLLNTCEITLVLVFTFSPRSILGVSVSSIHQWHVAGTSAPHIEIQTYKERRSSVQ